jgi:hypothetical protein
MDSLQFRAYDARDLRPLGNLRDEWNAGSASYNLLGAPEIAAFAIPPNLADGYNSVEFPQEFSISEEMLILVNRATPGIDLCVWSVDAARQTILVLPQRWWNESDVDFGYQ